MGVAPLDRVDRLERLTDLVLVLLEASSPRTLDEIARAVPGYPEGRAARRQAFERDKRVLRDEGIPVLTEAIDGPDQFGYRIDPDDLYLPDLELAPDEQAALQLAVAGVHLGDPSGRDALAKLGASGATEAQVLVSLSPPRNLPVLFDALRSSSEVRFAYRDSDRSVAPAALRFHGGRWYLVGWDRERAAPRTFRVDRIDGTIDVGDPESGRPPEDFRAEDATVEPWRPAAADEVDHVVVEVDRIEAPRVVAEVGERAVVGRGPDGSVRIDLGISDFGLLRSWVLGLLDHAEVVSPPVARRAVAGWLAELASGPEPAGPPTAAVPLVPVAPDPESGPRTAGASARLRRLLALVGWLAHVGEAPIADIAARFGLSESEVVHELELAACCGVPPYTPDALLEIVVLDDVARAFLPKELARARRLTPAEGLALAATARAVLAVPGADAKGPLARALAKLEAVLGDRGNLVIDIDAPPRLDEVRDALDTGVQVEIEYHSAASDETTVRVVEPLSVAGIDGHWYLDAWCHSAEGVRRFRVDRILALRRLGVAVTGRGRDGPWRADAFVPGPSAQTATLVLEPEAQWIADSLPVLARGEAPDGTVHVVLAVGGRAWLERVLLQAGRHARVLAPSGLAAVGADAAARLLRKYA